MKKTYNVQTLFREAIPRSQRLRNTSGTSNSVSALGGNSHTHANKTTLDALLDVDADGYLYVQHLANDSANKVKSGYADIAGDSAKWGGWAFGDFFERVNVGTDDTPIYALRVKIGIFSDSFVSSKGASSDTGEGGGTGIDLTRMWEELASVDATKLIDLSHMPSSVKTAVNWVSTVTSDDDTDAKIDKWHEIVSFLNGIDDTNSLSSILSGKANTSVVTALDTRVTTIENNYVAKARKVSAGTGLTGGGDLSADRTLSLATIGTAGTYTKVVVDAYGRVTGNSTLLESDIPALSISKITNLQSTINTINANFANYLPLTGGILTGTLEAKSFIRVVSDSAQILLCPYTDSAYIEFGNKDFTGNVPTYISGYKASSLEKLVFLSNSTTFSGSITIGGADGVTLSYDTVNDMLKFSKGGYFLGAVSTKGVSNDTGSGSGVGVDLSAVWQSLTTNTDAYGTTKIHIDHIPTLTSAKISDFASTVESLLPTNVSQFANDAGYVTASAIINKADKATTIQDYGLWEKYTDLNDAPMGAFFCGGTSVANSPESGNYISGITLARDKNTSFRTQLGFVSERLFTRQESGTNKWSSWKELAFKATTLAGYGITDGVTLGSKQTITGEKIFKNDGYYTGIFNSTLSDGKVRLLLMNNDEVKLMLAYDGLGSFLYDYGSAQTLRIQNDGDLLFTKSIIASSQLKSNVATGTAPLVVNSTTMVANLNANYLGGLNKDSYQKAVYDYVNVSGTADTTALPTVLAPSNYNGANYLGGNFKYYDTKFFSTQTNTSNRCQLAYGYDVDSIHFRRYYNGTWYDWKKVPFTEGEDNIQVTNAYARFTANNGALSGFFGFSGNVIGAYSTSLAEWLISASTTSICIAPQGKVNVGVKTWTPAYDFHVNGSIGANSLTIGQATISWDSTNQMLKVDTGAYFLGPVSTKGVSNGSGLVAVAQFGVTWQDSWYIEGGTTINAYGTTTKSISEDQGSVNGSEISITCNAFAGKKVGDIEIFTLGWDGEPSADARLVPFAIYDSTLICTLRLNGTMIPTNFKIKIY